MGVVLDVVVEDEPAPDDIATLVAGLSSHNAARADAERPSPIAVFARLDGDVVGGADGRTHWSWLYISHLWVSETLRGSGLGSQLLTTIERAARARGCRAAWLDTFSFQAQPFYARMGYREFGRLHDFPPGHSRHYFWKDLR
jgi:GNAT superfamily N-acetyltransferase